MNQPAPAQLAYETPENRVGDARMGASTVAGAIFTGPIDKLVGKET